MLDPPKTRRILATVLAAVLVLHVRARGAPSSAGRLPDPQRTAEHLAEAIRFETISHQDPSEDNEEEFAGFRAFLERTYPNVHRSLVREIIGDRSLLYRWKGDHPSAKPALFLAHHDVVPVEPGTEAAWIHPPFPGAVADGFVWGRGAMDDKASLIFLMEGAESLLAEGFRPWRDVYLASGADEEVGGFEGAAKIASLLHSRGVRLEFVLDEGGSITEGIVPDVKEPVALIGIAEKGYVSVELVAEMEGGHSSMPGRDTAMSLLARAIERLVRHQMPARLGGAARKQMETLAPHMPFVRRVVLSNLWLFEPLVTRRLEQEPATNAMVRTTTAPTIFESGVKENVLPSGGRAVVNFRILPGDSVEGVLAHVRDVVADDRVRVAKLERMISEPSPESSTESRAYRLLETTIRDLFPGAVTSPSLIVGATDSRHFAPLADDVYRFLPSRILAEDLKRVHGTDERLPVDQVGPGVEFYRRVLREGSGSGGETRAP